MSEKHMKIYIVYAGTFGCPTALCIPVKAYTKRTDAKKYQKKWLAKVKGQKTESFAWCEVAALNVDEDVSTRKRAEVIKLCQG